jgi:hypothetical protein
MPAAEEVEVALDPADLRIDVYRSSGPGGQSVNTTDSAVRITYRAGTPDELVVTCQDGKSQTRTRRRRSRCCAPACSSASARGPERGAGEARLVQIGGGDRSEKIRTYNVPQSRVTDHRIGFTTHDLAGVMAGGSTSCTARSRPRSAAARPRPWRRTPGRADARWPTGGGGVARREFVVAAAILLDRQGRVLLVGNDWQGYGKVRWTLPGGVVERGESTVDALSREVLEETG